MTSPTLRTLAAPLLASLLILAVPSPAAAQAPDKPHRTITTQHFRVHFTPELEPLARRAAASAERAYARLAAELVAPRGPIDLVVADNVDYANGSATVFPSNRIVVYAHPPIESPALRFTDDWMDLVVTHELAHIFHIDRSRGAWRGLQYVFGRSPILFPNAYTPRWLSEGIATYYETRLTGSGRIAGTTHAAFANAAALEGRLPRIDQLSLATPVFPGGQGVYIYGSLFVDHIARTRGDDKVRALIERQAVHPLPFMLNRVARASIGSSFSAAWNDFTDTLDAGAGDATPPPLPGWRDLSPPSFSAEFLRWTGADSLVYTGAAPRELFGAYRVDPDGSTRRFLGRRNGVTPHSRTADGTLVYAQPDFTDPFRVRGDLYLERRGRARRVTKGARISAPDARADGRVVAVQAVTGGSRLVTYDIATGALRPITSGGPDEFWAEPRWSPDGRSIAAVHWRRGGTSAIAILDPEGTLREEFSVARAVQSSPSWSPEGPHVLFASDREGRSDIYVATLDQAPGTDPRPLRRLGTGVSALYDPQVSPDGRYIAATRLGAEGFRVGVAPLGAMLAPGAESAARLLAERPARLDTVTAFAGESRRYSALRQLLPRFWFPLYEDDRVDTRFGAYTSSSDILDRHAYVAQLAVPVRGRGVEGGISYQYAGLTRPVIGVSLWQNWTYRGSVFRPDSSVAARLDRVERDAAISAVFRRPRVRSNLTASISAGAQVRRNSLSPEVPTNAPLGFFVDSVLPRVSAGIGYARTASAPYAISPEDGFTASLGAINHWVSGFAAPSSRTAIGAVTGYKSFDLGGYARHVAALRLAAGGTDVNSVNELRAGGVSGGTIPLAFGLGAVGEGRRNFFVRGFEDGTLVGTRAWAASAEYRAPLAMFARGAGLLPLFLDRTSVSGFADAASAWCPEFVAGLCYADNPRATIGSVGAEARLVAALGSWDAPFAFRLGVAVPVLEPERAPDRATVYFTSGLSF